MAIFFKDIQAELEQSQRAIISYKMGLSIEPTFCIIELIKTSVQSNNKIIFILTSENYAHYELIFLKQGLNITQYIQNGKIQIIDLFSKGTSYINDELPVTESFPRTWLDCPQSKLQLQQDYANLIESILDSIKVHFDSNDRGLIIIDDIYTFQILMSDRYLEQANEKMLFLLQAIRGIQQQWVQFHIFEQSNDYDKNFMMQFLQKHSNCVVEITAPASGYSKDLDGIITVEMRNTFNKKQKLLYKLDQCKIITLNAIKIN